MLGTVLTWGIQHRLLSVTDIPLVHRSAQQFRYQVPENHMTGPTMLVAQQDGTGMKLCWDRDCMAKLGT